VTESNRQSTPPSLTPYLIVSTGICVLQIVLSPPIIQYWGPLFRTVFPQSESFYYVLWFGLIFLWILTFAMAMHARGKRALWLLLGAPFAFLPLWLVLALIWSCGTGRGCA
jgi:hypothetical protein